MVGVGFIVVACCFACVLDVVCWLIVVWWLFWLGLLFCSEWFVWFVLGELVLLVILRALIGLDLVVVCCVRVFYGVLVVWCLLVVKVGWVGFGYCGFVWFMVVIIVGCSCIVAILVVCS